MPKIFLVVILTNLIVFYHELYSADKIHLTGENNIQTYYYSKKILKSTPKQNLMKTIETIFRMKKFLINRLG